MTEEEWFAAKTVNDLDIIRSAMGRHRKFRLFAAAYCQRAVNLAGNARLQPVVLAIESFADEQITWEEMKKIRRILWPIQRVIARNRFHEHEALINTVQALDRSTGQKLIYARHGDRYAKNAFVARAQNRSDSNEMERLRSEEEDHQLHLARDIFGNPFRPVAFDPRWQTSTSIGIAQTMYESRDFGAMPILADALQDAGCEDDAILSHCRDPKQPHVRGCWVVDLVLGKS